MHDCQRFREDWVAGLAKDFGDCKECQSFCEEAEFILQATVAKPIPELSEAFWDRYDDRLRDKLEDASRPYWFYWKWPAAAAAAAAVVAAMTWGGMRVSQPLPDSGNANANADAQAIPRIELIDDHIKGLNPTVVSFMAQSELYLRNFTKIDPSYRYREDLQDAQARAKQVLAEIRTQRLRAADFAPVGIALDEYENVLRDIKNLDSADDVGKIQTVIRSSGLIASMKAYQPQVMLVGRR